MERLDPGPSRRWKAPRRVLGLAVLAALLSAAAALWILRPSRRPGPPAVRAGGAEAALPENPAEKILASMHASDRLIRINDSVHQSYGFGSTFLVTTPEGAVVIDTGSPGAAARHRRKLRQVSDAKVRYIILTHAHRDHVGGVDLWKEPGTRVIAHRGHLSFRQYLARLAGHLGRPFGEPRSPSPAGARRWADKRTGQRLADTLFDDEHRITLGGVEFHLLHTPGETEDHLTVWMPGPRIAFVGDNWYRSFPNLYTLRGTTPRWPLVWIWSLNRIIDLRPEIMASSHDPPVRGREQVRVALERFREAIRFVHDRTVEGMNQGKDVYTLMREIRLPPHVELPEVYGRVSWSVRGIYEGYVGWFKTDPAELYAVPPQAIYPDLVRLAGGPDAVASLARVRLLEGRPVEALRLTSVTLSLEMDHGPSLAVREQALVALHSRSINMIESLYLRNSIQAIRGAKGRPAPVEDAEDDPAPHPDAGRPNSAERPASARRERAAP